MDRNIEGYTGCRHENWNCLCCFNESQMSSIHIRVRFHLKILAQHSVMEAALFCIHHGKNMDILFCQMQ